MTSLAQLLFFGIRTFKEYSELIALCQNILALMDFDPSLKQELINYTPFLDALANLLKVDEYHASNSIV